jgi:hypothetical protein
MAPLPTQDPRKAPLTVSVAVAIIVSLAGLLGAAWAVLDRAEAAVTQTVTQAVASHERAAPEAAHEGLNTEYMPRRELAPVLVEIRAELKAIRATLEECRGCGAGRNSR